MSATMEQLVRAHSRMLGRIEAATVENRRALRAGDHERGIRAGRDATRRLRAAMRITDAMRGAR